MRFFAVALLLFAWALQRPEPNRGAEKTRVKERNTQQKAQNKETKPTDLVAPLHVVPSEGSAVQGPHAKRKQTDPYDPRNDRLYRRYLWATIIGVIGGFIGIGLLCWQAIITRTAANAALASANAVINAERAWVMVSLEHVPGYDKGRFTHLRYENNGTVAIPTIAQNVRVVFKNDGKTPAWTTERCAALLVTQEVPEKPPAFIPNKAEINNEPLPLSVGVADHWDTTPGCDGSELPDNSVILYGVVRYRDVFEKSRETWFGYDVRHGNFTRLTGYPEYNKNT